jgi:hypothetical protein
VLFVAGEARGKGKEKQQRARAEFVPEAEEAGEESMARSRVTEEETLPSGTGTGTGTGTGKEMEMETKPARLPTVPYLKLFSFATGIDYLLMLGGTLGACLHGAALPLAVYLFGNIVDSIGIYFFDPPRLYQDASKVLPLLPVLAECVAELGCYIPL